MPLNRNLIKNGRTVAMALRSGHRLNLQTFVCHILRGIKINFHIHNEIHLMLNDADFERVLSFWAAWEQLQTAQEDSQL